MATPSAPRFNPRPLFILLGILLVVGFGIHLIHGVQVERHAEAWRNKAETANQDGKPKEELAALENYLQYRPGDSMALLRFAQLSSELNPSFRTRWAVVDIYSRFLDEQPLRNDIRKSLVEELLSLNAYSDAIRHVNVLLEASPDDPALLEDLGVCQAALREFDKAANTLQRSVDLAPKREKATIRLAWLLRQELGQNTRADKLMDQLVHHNPDSLAAWKARSAYWLTWGDADLLAESLERAAELDPNDLEVLKERANFAEKRGRFSESESLWKEAIGKHDDQPYLYRRLGSLLLATGKPTEATLWLERGVDKFPDDSELWYLLIGAQLDHDNPEEAERTIEKIPSETLPLGMRDYLLARVAMKRQDWRSALKLLKGVLDQTRTTAKVGSEAAVALGECYSELRDPENEVKAYREAVHRQNKSSRARLAYAEALLRRGRVSEALAQCRELAERPLPPPEFWPLYSKVLFRHQLTLPPNTRQWKDVEVVLEKAAEFSPSRAEVAIIRAEYLLAREQADDAEAILLEAQKDAPDDPELLAALIRLARRRGDSARVAELQRLARSREKTALDALLLELEQVTASGEYDKVRSLAKRIETEAKAAPKEKRVRILTSLAMAHHRLGKLAAGNQYVSELADLAGSDLALLPAVVELAIRGRADRLIDELIAKLKKLEGTEGTWWHFAEAKRLLMSPELLDADRLRQASILIDEVLARRPDWLEPLLLKARLLDQRQQPRRAKETYSRAFANGASNRADLARLFELLFTYGEDKKADEVIRRIPLESLPPEMARLGAELALRQEDPQRALLLADRGVSAQNKDYRLQVWLGTVLDRAGKEGSAVQALQKAVQLESRVAEPWVALLKQLRKRNDFPTAEKTFAKMQEAVLPARRTLAIAKAEEAMGRNRQAAVAFGKAIEENPADVKTLVEAAKFFVRVDDRPRAKSVLDKLLEFGSRLPTSYRTWARRELALVVAADGSSDGYSRAVDLLESNRRESPENPKDERAKLLVEATRKNQRTAALKKLKTLVPERTFSNNEMYRLALSLDKANDWKNASAHFERLITSDTTNPTYLVRLIEGLLRRGKRTEAKFWWPRLEKLEPTWPGADSIRKRLGR